MPDPTLDAILDAAMVIAFVLVLGGVGWASLIKKRR